MEDIPKSSLQSIVVALLYILLFLILLPTAIRFMDERWGQVLYGVLALGAVLVAFRLRMLFRDQ